MLARARPIVAIFHHEFSGDLPFYGTDDGRAFCLVIDILLSMLEKMWRRG